MSDNSDTIKTDRLRLRRWQEADRPLFAEMNADPEVSKDLGGPLPLVDSNRKLDRYIATIEELGFGRWAIEDHDGNFLGYAGVMPSWHDHPLEPHYEVGWRLVRKAWGHGYAKEAAKAALDDAFQRVGLNEILAYTTPENIRSQAVMARLGLKRDASRDFDAGSGATSWHGLVWVATP